MTTVLRSERFRSLSAPMGALSGIAALIVGALLIFVPRQAAEVVVFLLAVVIGVKGVALVVEASNQRDPMWGWRVMGGLVGLVAGLTVIATLNASTLITVVVAYYVLAGGVVIAGLVEIINGFGAPRSWWSIAIGALEMLLAVAIMFVPTTGAIIMLQLVGACLIGIGGVVLASSFRRS